MLCWTIFKLATWNKCLDLFPQSVIKTCYYFIFKSYNGLLKWKLDKETKPVNRKSHPCTSCISATVRHLWLSKMRRSTVKINISKHACRRHLFNNVFILLWTYWLTALKYLLIAYCVDASKARLKGDIGSSGLLKLEDCVFTVKVLEIFFVMKSSVVLKNHLR